MPPSALASAMSYELMVALSWGERAIDLAAEIEQLAVRFSDDHFELMAVDTLLPGCGRGAAERPHGRIVGGIHDTADGHFARSRTGQPGAVGERHGGCAAVSLKPAPAVVAVTRIIRGWPPHIARSCSSNPSGAPAAASSSGGWTITLAYTRAP
jgi:hypothetical protein